MAELGRVDQDKLSEIYMIQCLKDKNLPCNGAALSYTEYNGPLVPLENAIDCQKIVLNYHKKWSGNQENKHYIKDTDERMEEEQQIAIHYLVVHARFNDFMIVGKQIPLVVDYTILRMNGKNVNIADMLMDRITKEVRECKIEKSDILKLIKYN